VLDGKGNRNGNGKGNINGRGIGNTILFPPPFQFK
jgi:hypothetical protein